MDQLLDFLEAQRDRPLGTIVYVGAGDGLTLDLSRYAALAPRSLVLVEGDPETAAELQRRVSHLPWVSVRALPVAPCSGTLRWRRYNLNAFNGTLDATPLQTYYPRLRAVEERELQAVALADLLDGATVAAHLNVLALNVPGQEDALLAVVPQQQLVAFDVIALRGCREALAAERSTADAAPHRMQRHSFRKKVVDNESQPLWPVTLMRFDAGRHRLQQLEGDLTAAREVQRLREARIAELETAYAELLAQARNAERRTAEHLQQVQQLNRAGEADTALLAERDAQIAELTRRCQSGDTKLREQETLLQALSVQLEAATGELAAARDSIAAARHAEEARAAAEHRGQDAEQRLHAALQQAAELAQQVRQLESMQTREVVRHQMLQDELHRAEGQIELIKDLLLGDAGL